MLWWIVTIELFHAKFSVQSYHTVLLLIPFTFLLFTLAPHND